MDANTVNDVQLIRAGYSSSAATTSNAGAKWGLRFVGRNDSNYDNQKSGAIYAVSEDSGAGYNRNVGLAFHTSSFDAVHTERMRINSSGNVGIGITSPSQKLSVNGNIYSVGGFVNASGYQLNGTYVVDSSRNLVNIGTITSGAITASNSIPSSTLLTLGSSSQTSFTKADWKTSAHSTAEAYILAYGASHSTQAGNFAMKNLEANGEIFFELASGVEPLRFASNGATTFNSAFTFPTADGSANQVLKTDGSGNVSWAAEASVSANTSISDADNNTKIQVEESADENKIRFDTAGVQRMVIDSTGVGIGEESIDANLHISDTNPNLKFEITGAGKWTMGMPAGQTYLAFDEANDALNTPTMVMTKTTKSVGIGTTAPSQKLHVVGKAYATQGFTTDGAANSYTWRAINNSSSSGVRYVKICRITATQSSRLSIELNGRSEGYGNGSFPAHGRLVGQLNNDDNYDFTYYDYNTGSSEVVTEIGQVDVDTASTDIYVKINGFAEIAAVGVISDGDIYPTTGNTGASQGVASAPTGYTAIIAQKIIMENTAGNVGIGTTTPTDVLEVSKQLSAAQTVDFPLVVTSRDDGNSINQLGGEGIGIKFRLANNSASTPATSFVGAGIAAIRETQDDANSATSLAFYTSQNDETLDRYMTIRSTGNVGIGTTNPGRKLTVQGATGDDLPARFVGGANTTHGSIEFQDPTTTADYKVTLGSKGDALYFQAGGSEKARITSGGDLLVGKTVTDFGVAGVNLENDGSLAAIRSGASPANFNRLASDGDIARFFKDGSAVGSIGVNSATPYMSGNLGGFRLTSSAGAGVIIPTDTSGNASDADNDLGISSARWRDLYLSGGLRGDTTFKNNAGTTEYARFDSSGNLLVGQSTADSTSDGHGLLATGRAYHTMSSAHPLQLNRKSNDGAIAVFQKDGSTVGSVGTSAGHLYVGAGGDTNLLFNDTANSIYPWDAASNDVQNGTVDLGASTAKFKDLHLSGQVNTNKLAVEDGTEGAPSITFQNDTNTGICRTASDQLRIVAGGAWRALFEVSGIHSSSNVYSAASGDFRNYGGEWHATTGTSGNGFKFTNTADSVDALAITSAGNATFAGTISSGAITSTGSTTDDTADALNVKDSSNTQLFRVRNDGVVLIGDNYLYVTSSQGAYFDGAVRFRNGITDDTGQLSFNSSTADITFNSCDLESVGTISSGNIITTGYLRGPSTFTIDPAAHGDDTGTVLIAGNLQVDGTTTTINSTTLTVDDKNITLASGSTNAAAANGAGLTVDCGSATDATFTYDGTNDEWDFNKNVKVSGSVGVTNILTNKVVKFNGTVLDDSTITDTGSLITLGTSTDVSGPLQFTSNVSFSSSEAGRIYKASNHGLAFHGVTGTENDFAMFTPAGQLMLVNPTGTNNVALVPTAGGNVGIGTDSPSYTLTLKDNSANTYIRFENTTTALGWIGYHGDGDLSFWTNASTRSMNITSSGNVGIGIEAAAAKLQIEDAGIDTTTTSTTATTQVAIDTFAAATFRSARYTIQVTNSTDSTYHITEVLLIHDGTTPQIIEYGTIFTGSAEATFDADISSGNVRLLATPTTTDSMTFKVVRHCITV